MLFGLEGILGEEGIEFPLNLTELSFGVTQALSD